MSLPTTDDSKAHNSHTSNNVLHAPTEDTTNKVESRVKSEKSATSNAAETSKTANGEPQTSNSSATTKQDFSEKEESLITLINSHEEFDKLKETIKDKYILVWFSAPWCAPCKVLAIKLQELAQKYRNKIEIFKVNVDDLEDLALENEVSVMPTYVIMRNGQKLDHYVGTKQEQIDELITKYLITEY